MAFIIIYCLISAVASAVITTIYYSLVKKNLRGWVKLLFVTLTFILTYITWPLQLFAVVLMMFVPGKSLKIKSNGKARGAT